MLTKGWKTSEFWLIMLANLLNLLIQANIFVVDSVWYKIISFAVTILASLGYAYGRSMVKSNVEPPK